MKTKPPLTNNHFLPSTQPVVMWLMLCVFAVVVWAGCQHQPAAASTNAAPGTFNLISINGRDVPCTIDHQGASPTVKSGTFTINADATCSSKIVFASPSGKEAVREVHATYTRQGPNLTMKWKGAGTTIGKIEGNTFSMNNEGMIFLYRK